MEFDLRATARRAMAENGFLPDFPPEVQSEVAALQEAAPAAARDLRGLLWSSIDNRESRDLDQLEVAERLPYDHIRLMVAIADVDEMVDKGSATDGHAGHSTTSVYAGPFVFPMLPERLSTDLTSLNPGEDRAAVVVEMDVGPGGAVVRHDVYRASVHSRAKLSYDAVGAWLEGGTGVPPEVAAVPGLEEQVRLQDEAAQRLRALRRRHGLLDLETIEARPVVAGGQGDRPRGAAPRPGARHHREPDDRGQRGHGPVPQGPQGVLHPPRGAHSPAVGSHRRPGRGAGREPSRGARRQGPGRLPRPPQGRRSRAPPRPLARHREAARSGRIRARAAPQPQLGRALRPRHRRIRPFHGARTAATPTS